ncbi:MAG TPA: type I phosphomannose isomerase catalytic subunit [Ktedonobacteraceae bacterium]|nr:type I phosphomannose isomerase catalytic subunit [Ktedonobacteraceae bacterium]
MQKIYPLRLEASLHKTLWGGRRLEEAGWKKLPDGEAQIGESWETEISTIIQNGMYSGKTLGQVVEDLGNDLLGSNAVAIFGQRFPLLAKFIDAREKLSVQVHPNDEYAAQHEGGKLGKTEFWFILDATPGAKIVHGFQSSTTREAVQKAIELVQLEDLLHEESVGPEDVIFVPAGTVHAIGSGVLLYELQEYSDVTYRMYDYGRLDAQGLPRELHVDRSLDVTCYEPSKWIKAQPVTLTETREYVDRCLIANRYFVCREIVLLTAMEGQTDGSCIIVSALGADLHVYYGEHLEQNERLARGQTMILPAKLGRYRLAGPGACLYSYVPASTDNAWQAWLEHNR